MLSGENEIIEFWKKEKIYEKLKEERKDGKKFYFLDGPPYASGKIHVGTAFNQTLKDSYRRFFRMRGFDVWDQPGFDTHGLPIENKVEKKFGFKNKREIEEFGIGKFVEECRKFATEHIGTMIDQFKNLGIWNQWDNPYLTLENDYIEGAWFTFKKGFEKGLLYKGTYPVHVCPHCATAVAYNEIEHKKSKDPSIYVKFKVKGKDEYLLIWTTTPWTLPANTAVMANPSVDYAKVQSRGEVFIISDRLVVKTMKLIGEEDYKIIEKIKGKDLENLEYEYPLAGMFKYQDEAKNAHRIVLSDQYVTLEDGTGFVHTAPGHGQEDYKIGVQNKLPSFSPVEMDGTFGKEAGELAGVFVKKANPIIVEELKKRNFLFKEDTLEHEYPFCWRCNSALMIISVPQWFFKITEIRDKLLKENSKVGWNPKWAGDRFRNWLENLGDWPISRQRYWGIPLPIWECEKCEEVKVIGSVKELPEEMKDLHKPYIDDVVLKCKCGSSMKRVPDVMDVWFDSGVAAWASLGYPKDERLLKRMWPADLIMEGPDQIRGWWNSMIITGVMAFDEVPFKNVLFHGFGLDSHGVKMSKSKGNIVQPEEVIEKNGRDVLRYYYLSKIPWDDFHFKWEDMKEISKSFYVIRNVFKFAGTYVKRTGSPDNMRVEDRWILSRLNSLVERCTKEIESFNSYKASRDIVNFILNDFSRWYIKIIRDRVWVGYEGEDRESAFYTVFTVAKTLTKLLAPFTPFMAEEFYQNIIREMDEGSKLSVHLENWPEHDRKMLDENLEKEMEIAKKVFETSQAARQEAEIKLRWPVRQIVVVSEEKEVAESVKNMNDVLLLMCNSKMVAVSKDKPKGDFVGNDFDHGILFLDKEMNEWTLGEAMFREVVRFVQNMRKVNKFNVNESIKLSIASDEKTIGKLEEYKEKIMGEVGAKEVSLGKEHTGEFSGKMKFKDVEIEISFDRL